MIEIKGLIPVRNEGWIIGFSLRAALMWMDSLVVLNHASTDDSREILEEIQGEVGRERLTILDHSDLIWRDVLQRQMLLEAGRREDGEFFALLDADEVLSGNLLGDVRGFMETLKPGECFNLPWIAIWKQIFRYRTKAHVTSWGTAGFRDSPLLHWRAEKGYDQHRRHPYESVHMANPPVVSGGIMHFQYVDWRRITAKHALYKMNDAWRFPKRKTAAELNAQYDATLSEAGLEVAATPLEWFFPYRAFLDKLKIGVEPWQEAACRKLWEEKGPKPFEGLDLYGVVGPILVKAPPPPPPVSAPKPPAPKAPVVRPVAKPQVPQVVSVPVPVTSGVLEASPLESELAACLAKGIGANCLGQV